MLQIKTPIAQMEADFGFIRRLGNMIPDLIEMGAEKAAVLVRERVEGRGLATNGSELITRSRKKIGHYGEWHGRNRQERGLQTDQVDFNFTGQMWSKWTVDVQAYNASVGFDDNIALLKSWELQDYYQVEIFVPSDSEIDIVAELIGEHALKNLFD